MAATFIGQCGLFYNADLRHPAQPGISVVETSSKSCPISGLEIVPLVQTQGRSTYGCCLPQGRLRGGPSHCQLDREYNIPSSEPLKQTSPLSAPWPLGGLCSLLENGENPGHRRGVKIQQKIMNLFLFLFFKCERLKLAFHEHGQHCARL